jgi:hypothetical protein
MNMKTYNRKLWFIHLVIFSLYTVIMGDTTITTDDPTSKHTLFLYILSFAFSR